MAVTIAATPESQLKLNVELNGPAWVASVLFR